MRKIIALALLASFALVSPASARERGSLEQRTADRINARTSMSTVVVVTALKSTEGVCAALGMNTEVDQARFNQNSNVRYEENPRNNYNRWSGSGSRWGSSSGSFYRNDWNTDQRPWSHYGSGTEVIVDIETEGEREVICAPKQ